MSVRLEQVGVTYSDGTAALSDINLSMQRQEQIALIGPSGSGKSSLLRVMSMALAPSTGVMSLDAMNPWQQKTARVQRMRSKIHRCSQSSPFPARQRVALAVLSGMLPTRSLAFSGFSSQIRRRTGTWASSPEVFSIILVFIFCGIGTRRPSKYALRQGPKRR